MTTNYLATVSVAVLLSVGAIVGCSQPSTSETPSPSQSASTVSSPDAVKPDAAKADVAKADATKSNVLKSGSFVAAEHPTSGTARIITENGKRFLEFDQSFRTDSGPDLYVILHKAPNILATTTPPAYAIREGDYLSLGRLKSTSGAQRYEIPKSVNLDNFKSAAVWCKTFNATFGAAGFSQ
jgi:hypothetical protein